MDESPCPSEKPRCDVIFPYIWQTTRFSLKKSFSFGHCLLLWWLIGEPSCMLSNQEFRACKDSYRKMYGNFHCQLRNGMTLHSNGKLVSNFHKSKQMRMFFRHAYFFPSLFSNSDCTPDFFLCRFGRGNNFTSHRHLTAIQLLLRV